jgi:hypothetical protein
MELDSDIATLDDDVGGHVDEVAEDLPGLRVMVPRATDSRGRRTAQGRSVRGGGCAILTSAALDLAASRYMTALAAKRGSPATIAKLTALASKLSMSARQQELTALEIASRESAARPRAPVNFTSIAWSPRRRRAPAAGRRSETSRTSGSAVSSP